MEINVGDKVRFLNDIGGGRVTKVIDRNSVLIMNNYGFEVPSRVTELVVIEEATVYKDEVKTTGTTKKEDSVHVENEIIVDTNDIFYPDVVIEPESGNDINLFMAFVPQGRPGNSDLNVFFINDSNYNVLYSIINIDDTGKSFSNSVGVLEANTKEQIETMGLNSVNQIPEYVFHLVFYKKGEFKVKEPQIKSISINPVRFYKEKAYTVNDFFNENALMLPVYTESALLAEVNKLSDKEVKQLLIEKEKIEVKPEYTSPKEKSSTLLEVDLHIHELLDDFRGLSNSEILEVQMNQFKSKLDEAIRAKVKRVVFIHGVGNGTLKLEIRRELEKKDKILTFQDASFKEYGYGATMVNLK